ncbi:MAG: hypothetical protein ACSLFP_11755, partial [Acidimicrobiales bacterium]
AAGAVLLGACGDDGESSAPSTSGAPTGGQGLALAQFFGGPLFVAGRPVRAPFGVADIDGLLSVDDTPESLVVTVLGPDSAPLGDPLEVARRAEGLPRGYFPLVFEAPEPGIYTARTEIDGEVAEMSLKVDTAADVRVVQPGDALPAIDTPTVDDARGVDPICTNDPVCPLHDVTLAEALTEARPIALLVATPAFCQIAICGPVLDVLLGVVDDHPDVRFVHAEPFAAPPDLEVGAPIVDALGLHFEPCLVLAGSDGSVVERLDTIYDRDELLAALGRLT